MKIFIIGGTGLLGSEAAKELIKMGHVVSCVALPPLPDRADLPIEMKVEFGNYLTMSDEDLISNLKGCEAFIFAAGVDERIEGPPPIYEMFKKYNIDPLRRLLSLAKECGVRHSVICGSYFSYFDKIWPEKELSNWHPYIRSRRDQETMALSFADENFDVAILELPYIFGTQVGRKPVWVFLVDIIKSMKGVTLYPKGGTTMITVRQAGQAIAGAAIKNKGGNCYPIGYYNMTWKEMLTIFHKYMGSPDKKIITIPKWMLNLKTKSMLKQQKAKNIQSGLDMVKFPELQCSNLFIDKALGCDLLGVEPDDIERAIGESVRLSMEILNKKLDVLDMRGE